MRPSTTQFLFDEMLRRIQTGAWSVGEAIPSERTLIKEFEVSRIALREALSMLRSIGVLDTSHGRKSIVQCVGTDLLARLMPLVVSLDATASYRQVFEIRLAIEVPAAGLAALRRTPADLERLDEFAAKYARHVESGSSYYPEADLEFHLQIARSSQNPLFTALLNVISRYVIEVQVQSWGSGVSVASDRASRAHFAILEAVRDQDPERSRVEMEAHLRYTFSLVRTPQPPTSPHSLGVPNS
jgi:GntR family transcriptional repressor for pyruvate dehydrogenase complex